VSQFERVRGRAGRKEGDLVTYCIFDLLFQNGEDLWQLALVERRKRLRKLIPKDHPRLPAHPERGSPGFGYPPNRGHVDLVPSVSYD
jgi:ATP-dependent DNA ligase